METVVSADGTPIAYDHYGDGPPLVTAAGAFCARTTTEPLARALAPQFTVLNYDRRGRGDSGVIRSTARGENNSQNAKSCTSNERHDELPRTQETAAPSTTGTWVTSCACNAGKHRECRGVPDPECREVRFGLRHAGPERAERDQPEQPRVVAHEESIHEARPAFR